MIDRSIYTSGLRLPDSHTAPTLLSTVQRLFSVWRQRQHLSQLDARMRADIGLQESDVVREVSRAVWDSPTHWLR